jgi:hypothetical protein
MRWSTIFLWIVTVLYACVSIFAFYEGSKGRALVFAGYTVANLGFILFE